MRRSAFFTVRCYSYVRGAAGGKDIVTSVLRSVLPVTVVCAALCTCAVARTALYRTYVAPASNETMQGPCEYELTLRSADRPVKAVLVIVERGWQVGNLYFDPDVAAFAERFDLALVLARHYRAKTEEDMDIIPEHGIGHALLQSITQFAQQSHYPELEQSKLILLRF